MKIFLITIFTIGSAWAGGVCSLNNFDTISPDIRAEFDNIYPNKLKEAQAALDSNGGRIDVGHRVFTNADDYARWASKLDATSTVSKSRLGELEDTIRDSWRRSGYSESQIDSWISKLEQKVNSGNAVWDKGNFRYVSSNGDIRGANLVPDDLQRALHTAQSEIATTAAKVGDQGAQEVVKNITDLSNARDAIVQQARTNGWSVGDIRGNTAVEIRSIDTTTPMGRKLANLSGVSDSQKVVMSFSEDGTSVAFHVVGADGKLAAPVKNINGTEFYQGLFQ